jgi:hypothetical protein
MESLLCFGQLGFKLLISLRDLFVIQEEVAERISLRGVASILLKISQDLLGCAENGYIDPVYYLLSLCRHSCKR